MGTGYTNEENVLMLVALMKLHGIKRVIASPGTTNITFVASLQRDPFFEIYSSVDERSAAYMACGMAAETGEPVVLSCTGATASRNYLPGLTEAYYRKLPVLAVTSTQHIGRVGQLVPQVIDRSVQQNDVCRVSVSMPTIHCADDRKCCELAANKALLALTEDGGGPAHINLATTYSRDYSVNQLPAVRAITRISRGDPLPSIGGKRVAVFVGAHRPFDCHLEEVIERFCTAFGAVVVSDHTGNYFGHHGVRGSLVLTQSLYTSPCKYVDILIHIGEVSGAYVQPIAQEVWRVSPDGQIRDPFGGLRYVFDMDEELFFDSYVAGVGEESRACEQLNKWHEEDRRLRARIDDLPFSNAWCAQYAGAMLPKDSVLYLGILNTLRSWNLFPITPGVEVYCNTGGFGIDGGVSSLVGGALASPGKLHLGIVGDLGCFYDLNVLGNRHVGSNMRLLVVNNGVGTEFKNYNHPAAAFGEEADAYMAARGHFGCQSPDLLRHFAEDLGFEYASASNKEDFIANVKRFVDPVAHDKPMLFEVFTKSDDESDALETLRTLDQSASSRAKNVVKGIIGDRGIEAVRKVIGK